MSLGIALGILYFFFLLYRLRAAGADRIMADQVRKLSSFIGLKKLDERGIERYIIDMDKDVFNLFQEKSLNLQEAKRYGLMAAVFSEA